MCWYMSPLVKCMIIGFSILYTKLTNLYVQIGMKALSKVFDLRQAAQICLISKMLFLIKNICFPYISLSETWMILGIFNFCHKYFQNWNESFEQSFVCTKLQSPLDLFNPACRHA